ncbi:MAG TPA: hypothetical protein VMS94_02085 [Acidobacteriota bacterium]|nr:hypothetical protein [Acidobacteriota bacterium]
MAERKKMFGLEPSRIRTLVILFVDLLLVIALVLLFQVDKLVNGTLYDYGLTFSAAWAEPYWTMLRSSLVLIVIAIIVISVVELPYPSFEKKKD